MTSDAFTSFILQVSRESSAQLPPLHHISTKKWQIKFVFLPILLALLIASFISYSNRHNSFYHISLSLPVIRQTQLVGREMEMNIIMDYLSDTEGTNVVTLFGQAGFGKSEIALHIGHKMVEKGVHVHYIKVEDYSNVASLEEALMAVSEAAFSDMRLVRWAKSLKKRTVLILDNVDGSYWVEKKARQQFQTGFVDLLLSHSKSLQVLITSQENLKSKYKSRYHQLHSLSTDNCILLVSSMAAQPQNLSASEVLCTLVGNVPMAIKVLTAILSPDYSLKYVIRRLNETMSSKKLKFLADTGDRVDKDRLLSAIELAFEFVEP